jgi:hypothetical protein
MPKLTSFSGGAMADDLGYGESKRMAQDYMDSNAPNAPSMSKRPKPKPMTSSPRPKPKPKPKSY